MQPSNVGANLFPSSSLCRHGQGIFSLLARIRWRVFRQCLRRAGVASNTPLDVRNLPNLITCFLARTILSELQLGQAMSRAFAKRCERTPAEAGFLARLFRLKLHSRFLVQGFDSHVKYSADPACIGLQNIFTRLSGFISQIRLSPTRTDAAALSPLLLALPPPAASIINSLDRCGGAQSVSFSTATSRRINH